MVRRACLDSREHDGEDGSYREQSQDHDRIGFCYTFVARGLVPVFLIQRAGVDEVSIMESHR